MIFSEEKRRKEPEVLYDIREATPRDIEVLVDLVQNLFEIESDFSPDHQKQKRGLEMLLTQDRSCILVAATDQTPVAMLSLQLVVSTAEGGYSAWVEDVIVHPRYRRYGIGTALLGAAEAWAARNGARRLSLLADQSNTPAAGFYQTLQWNETNLICHQKHLIQQ